MLKKQINCPKCNGPCGDRIRYAFSSWLLPVKCRSCGSNYYLGYSPLMFAALWVFISPLYLTALLFLAVIFLPDPLILPGFILIGILSMFLLVYLGAPRLKQSPPGRPPR